MRIVRNKKQMQIEFIDEEQRLIGKVFLMPKELVWSFNKNIDYKNPIEISRKDDKTTYDNLIWFMDQEYVKKDTYKSQYDKDKDYFIWISEHIDNTDTNSQGKNHTARLIIKRIEDSIIIYPFIPIINNNGNRVIIFSYKRDRYKALNLQTNTAIQDDMLLFYKKTFNDSFIEDQNQKLQTKK